MTTPLRRGVFDQVHVFAPPMKKLPAYARVCGAVDAKDHVRISLVYHFPVVEVARGLLRCTVCGRTNEKGTA